MNYESVSEMRDEMRLWVQAVIDRDLTGFTVTELGDLKGTRYWLPLNRKAWASLNGKFTATKKSIMDTAYHQNVEAKKELIEEILKQFRLDMYSWLWGRPITTTNDMTTAEINCMYAFRNTRNWEDIIRWFVEGRHGE